MLAYALFALLFYLPNVKDFPFSHYTGLPIPRYFEYVD